MISCKRATELMTTRELRRLTVYERYSLRLHTVVCSACSHFEQQLLLIKSAIKAESDAIPGSEFMNTLERMIRERGA